MMNDDYQATSISDEEYQILASALIYRKEQPELLRNLSKDTKVAELLTTPIQNPPMDFLERLEAALTKQVGTPVELFMSACDVTPTESGMVSLNITFDYKLYEKQSQG